MIELPIVGGPDIYEVLPGKPEGQAAGKRIVLRYEDCSVGIAADGTQERLMDHHIARLGPLHEVIPTADLPVERDGMVAVCSGARLRVSRATATYMPSQRTVTLALWASCAPRVVRRVGKSYPSV